MCISLSLSIYIYIYVYSQKQTTHMLAWLQQMTAYSVGHTLTVIYWFNRYYIVSRKMDVFLASAMYS